MYTNEVTLMGTISTNIILDHTYMGKNFYKFWIRVERLSGIFDEIPIVISEEVLKENGIEFEKGVSIFIDGDYRSQSRFHDGKNSLILYVYAKKIEKITELFDISANTNNTIYLYGYVCKKGELRVTPAGKKIVDVLIAAKNEWKTYYIPCIIWNWDKNYSKKIKEGDELSLKGRIQSRQYTKIENGVVTLKTAYEVSVLDFTVEK